MTETLLAGSIRRAILVPDPVNQHGGINDERFRDNRAEPADHRW